MILPLTAVQGPHFEVDHGAGVVARKSLDVGIVGQRPSEIESQRAHGRVPHDPDARARPIESGQGDRLARKVFAGVVEEDISVEAELGKDRPDVVGVEDQLRCSTDEIAEGHGTGKSEVVAPVRIDAADIEAVPDGNETIGPQRIFRSHSKMEGERRLLRDRNEEGRISRHLVEGRVSPEGAPVDANVSPDMVAAMGKKIVVPSVIGEAQGGSALGPVPHLLKEGGQGWCLLRLLWGDGHKEDLLRLHKPRQGRGEIIPESAGQTQRTSDGAVPVGKVVHEGVEEGKRRGRGGIEKIGVGDGERVHGDKAAEFSGEAHRVPRPEDVVLGDRRHAHDPEEGAVSSADGEGSCGLFLDLDVQVDEVVPHLLGNDLDVFEEVQVVQVPVGVLKGLRIHDPRLLDPQHPTDDLVPGQLVSGDVDFTDMDKAPFSDQEGQVDRLFPDVGNDLRSHDGKGVPLVAVFPGQIVDVLLEALSGEDLRGLGLDGVENLFRLEELVARDTHVADPELLPFGQGEANFHGLSMVVEDRLGFADGHIDIPVVQVEVPKPLDILFGLSLLVDSGVCPPGSEPEIGLGLDLFLKGGIGEGLVSGEADLRDVGQGPFGDEEEELDLVVGYLAGQGNDRGIVVSGLLVEGLNAANVFVDLISVIKGGRKNRQFFSEVRIGLVIVPDEGDLFDSGPFRDPEGQGHTSLEPFGKDLDPVEVAGLVEGLDVAGKGGLGEGIAHLCMDLLSNGRAIDLLVSLDVDAGDQNRQKSLGRWSGSGIRGGNGKKKSE